MTLTKLTQWIWWREVFWKNVFWHYLRDIMTYLWGKILLKELMLSFTFLLSMKLGEKLINQLDTLPSINKYQNRRPSTLKYFNLSEPWMNSDIKTSKHVWRVNITLKIYQTAFDRLLFEMYSLIEVWNIFD